MYSSASVFISVFENICVLPLQKTYFKEKKKKSLRNATSYSNFTFSAIVPFKFPLSALILNRHFGFFSLPKWLLHT